MATGAATAAYITAGIGAASATYSISEAEKNKSAQKKALKAEKALLSKEEARVTTEEQERLKRVQRGMQGKRSLLYSGTGEQGVSDTLGG